MSGYQVIYIRIYIGSSRPLKLTSEMRTILVDPIMANSPSFGQLIVRQAQTRLEPGTY